MQMNEILRTTVGPDDALSRNTPAIRRARFIVAIADLSASGGMFRYPEYLGLIPKLSEFACFIFRPEQHR